MSSRSAILINHLSYSHSDKPIFQDLNLALPYAKSGLVGRNGVGKSTLLKLIMGQLQPQAGAVQLKATIAYCPQETLLSAQAMVADLLEIGDKYRALCRIQAGSVESRDFEIINEDWDFATRAEQALTRLGLDYLRLDRAVASLSGGERTRCVLAHCFAKPVDYLILDEPTNNLDQGARQYLYQAVQAWQGGLLVVSHDRDLLNLLDQIVELNTLGLQLYGGNYASYLMQKNVEEAAKQQQLLDARKALHRVEASAQLSYEKHERRQAKGVAERRAGKIDKISANSARGRSERSQSRLSNQKEKLIEQAGAELAAVKSGIELNETITVALPFTQVPQGKVVLKLRNVSFAYPRHKALIQNFNLLLQGPERVALVGNNGSGKTTLVKLILQELTAQQGEIQLGVERVRYFDQTCSLLNPQQTLLDNYLRLNRESTTQEAHAHLAQFLFRNTAALKQVSNLSGGEKLRAALACTLLAKQAPQLLILDEPTNHLDLASIKSIESALQHYQGALIVISHERQFLQNLQIQRVITAPFING